MRKQVFITDQDFVLQGLGSGFPRIFSDALLLFDPMPMINLLHEWFHHFAEVDHQILKQRAERLQDVLSRAMRERRTIRERQGEWLDQVKSLLEEHNLSTEWLGDHLEYWFAECDLYDHYGSSPEAQSVLEIVRPESRIRMRELVRRKEQAAQLAQRKEAAHRTLDLYRHNVGLYSVLKVFLLDSLDSD